MIIAVASDHRGVKAVEQIKAIVAQFDHECLDFSPTGVGPVICENSKYLHGNKSAAGNLSKWNS